MCIVVKERTGTHKDMSQYAMSVSPGIRKRRFVEDKSSGTETSEWEKFMKLGDENLRLTRHHNGVLERENHQLKGRIQYSTLL